MLYLSDSQLVFNPIYLASIFPGAGFTSPQDKGHLKFKDFLEILPSLKNLSFTKPPSLKETLKTPLNFKEAKDLP